MVLNYACRRIDAGRRQRYYVRQGEKYRIEQSLRDDIVFAQQNLIADSPPGSHQLPKSADLSGSGAAGPSRLSFISCLRKAVTCYSIT